MTTEHQNNVDTDFWEDRILCPDESCTGTIGSDGRCRVCGLTADGKVQPAALSSSEATEPSEAAIEPEDDLLIGGPDESELREDEDDAPADWADRQPCRDESCIGTIGVDGRCRECGLPCDPDTATESG